MKILYPGTFDPLTNGHLDLIERAEKIFGNLVVAVLENTSKTPTFNLERRIIQIKNSLSHLPNIEVISYSGLYSFLSSSLVKEVAKFGGEINHMVPPSVERDLKEYFK